MHGLITYNSPKTQKNTCLRRMTPLSFILSFGANGPLLLFFYDIYPFCMIHIVQIHPFVFMHLNESCRKLHMNFSENWQVNFYKHDFSRLKVESKELSLVPVSYIKCKSYTIYPCISFQYRGVKEIKLRIMNSVVLQVSRLPWLS